MIMIKKKYSLAMRIGALLLAMMLSVPVYAKAATAETVQPRASDYLCAYNAYVHPAANAKIQVWFSVIGVDYLDSIGALTIQIFHSADNVNWTLYKTFLHNDNPQMLSYNDNYHNGHVECQGVAGRYYKAYVCIWGGSDGDGDTRYFYTSAKKAVITPS